jgi:hypothetical protein
MNLALSDVVWVEVETATAEEDRDTEVLAVREATSRLDPLDLAVDPHFRCFGDATAPVGQDVGQVRFEPSRHLLDRIEPPSLAALN